MLWVELVLPCLDKWSVVRMVCWMGIRLQTISCRLHLTDLAKNGVIWMASVRE